MMLYDVTGFNNTVSGKAGHEASKGAVTYYNASFVDVSYSICCWKYFCDILE